MQLSFADVKKEFDESLGYIRGDIRTIRAGTHSLNYTVALLVGCGCEMLAACRDARRRKGEIVFAEMLPAGDWQVLADRIYNALRDGLAHSFDTKHILVGGTEHQLYISWGDRQIVRLAHADGGVGLYIGVGPLAEALCTKIDEFEVLLQNDPAMQLRFMEARQRPAQLDNAENEAWHRLLSEAAL